MENRAEEPRTLIDIFHTCKLEEQNDSLVSDSVKLYTKNIMKLGIILRKKIKLEPFSWCKPKKVKNMASPSPAVALLAAALIAATTCDASSTTYYASSVRGSDANSGTSADQPFKTLAKLR